MHKQAIATAFVSLGVIAGQPVFANNCQKLVVTAPDGYVNVRSTPQVKPNNIVMTLPSGVSINKVSQRNGWLQINSPFEGWISGNQAAKISCAAAWDYSFNLGHPTIKRLGERAIRGDRKAAETLVKMSEGVDGSTAEVFAEAITKWANQNCSFMIAVLNQQFPPVRQAFLSWLDFGLGAEQSQERQRFEQFLNQLPFNTPVIQDWKNRHKSYAR